MAVTLSSSGSAFFGAVLGGNPQTFGKYSVLVDSGIKFSVELYAIKALNKDGKGLMLNLTTSTSSMLLGAKNPSPDVLVATNQLVKFINDLHTKYIGANVPTTTPVAPEAGPVETVVAKVEPVKVVPPVTAAPVSAAPQIKPGVIKLVDAEAIGQPVKGTSSGSVYKVVAVNPRVKVAARLQGNNLSLRCEFENPTAKEEVLIKASGMAWNTNYASMHLTMDGIPAARVVGAFLYGLGIKFDRVIQIGEDMTV